jgi:hypothetical protein
LPRSLPHIAAEAPSVDVGAQAQAGCAVILVRAVAHHLMQLRSIQVAQQQVDGVRSDQTFGRRRLFVPVERRAVRNDQHRNCRRSGAVEAMFGLKLGAVGFERVFMTRAGLRTVWSGDVISITISRRQRAQRPPHYAALFSGLLAIGSSAGKRRPGHWKNPISATSLLLSTHKKSAIAK